MSFEIKESDWLKVLRILSELIDKETERSNFDEDAARCWNELYDRWIRMK